MAKLLAVLLPAVLLAGCVTPGEGWGSDAGETRYVLVETVPTGATLSFPDGTTCEAPCRVGITTPLTMTVARIGYDAQTMTLDRGGPQKMVVELIAVGRSTPLEEVALPEL